MNVYDVTVPLYTKMLTNLEQWIVKAVAYAGHRKFDPEILTHARLAPDQFALVGQVQAACDTAKYAVAKLTGSEPPSHPDTEKTLEELRQRIHTCLDYIGKFGPTDFEGAEERACSHTWMRGKSLRGSDYLIHYALPNFHFHVVTAYAILRHNGVELGKLDFLAGIPL